MLHLKTAININIWEGHNFCEINTHSQVLALQILKYAARWITAARCKKCCVYSVL